MTVLDITPQLRESIEARIARLRADAAEQYAIADALAGHSDGHRNAASRLQFQAEELAAKLEGED